MVQKCAMPSVFAQQQNLQQQQDDGSSHLLTGQRIMQPVWSELWRHHSSFVSILSLQVGSTLSVLEMDFT